MSFTIVARRKPRHEPEVMETILAYPVDWDWGGEWPAPIVLGSFRELRKWGESKKWYHGFSPSRQLIYGRKDGGKHHSFPQPSDYHLM